MTINPDGVLEFIYSDTLAGLLAEGAAVVERASHVEPEPTPDGIKWFADMAPSNGPKLGPFDTRELALSEEVEWLTTNRL